MNVQTLNFKKISELEILLDEFPSVKFLCFNETCIKEDAINQLTISSFKLAASYCRPIKNGGGTAIWTRTNIIVKPINLERNSIEGQCELSAVSFKTDCDNFIIINCYRPPSGDVDTFLYELNAVFESLYKPGIKFVICGDFNSDSLNESSKFKRISLFLLQFGLGNTVFWPTRVTTDSISCIDHVYLNFVSGTTCVLDFAFSDHRLILSDINFGTIDVERVHSTYRRSFNSDNINRFCYDLGSEDWSFVYAFNDLETAFNQFYDIFLFHFNNRFPLSMRYVQQKPKKWVNDVVRKSSSELRFLHSLSQEYTQFEDIYKEKRRAHKSLIKFHKRMYYQNRIEESENLTKETWNVVSEINGFKSKKIENVTISENGSKISDPEVVASRFNDFFKEAPLRVVERIKNKVSNTNNIIPSSDDVKNELNLYPFNGVDLYDLIMKKLKNKKSCGEDGIPSFLIKKIFHIILSPFCHLINLSFCEGKFPSELKIGKIIPIYKKNDKQNVENYRPVTIPSTFSKIFEYCFLERLLDFLGTNKKISETQHGFCSQRSTITAVHAIHDKIVTSLEAGECPVGIFCDLSRAFDCVNHDILIARLEEMGISGTPLNWVKTFLTGRTQYVEVSSLRNGKLRKICSNTTEVTIGVPQGSVVAPILFVIYVNSVDSAVPREFIIKYADDKSVVISGKSQEETIYRLSTALLGLGSWFSESSLHFNMEKTLLIQFHNPQKKLCPLSVEVDRELCSQVDHTKFLGIYIDENMNYKYHCEILISKLHSICYKFKNLRYVLTTEQLITVYYAEVQSRLTYGICLWGWSANVGEVFLAQKRVIRRIAGIGNRTSCRQYFLKYGILTLYGLYIFEMCVYVHINLNNFVQIHSYHEVNTRQRNKDILHQPFAKHSLAYRSPNFAGPRFYNKIPNEIKNLPLPRFKKKLKDFLVSKCIYSLNDFLG